MDSTTTDNNMLCKSERCLHRLLFINVQKVIRFISTALIRFQKKGKLDMIPIDHGV